MVIRCVSLIRSYTVLFTVPDVPLPETMRRTPVPGARRGERAAVGAALRHKTSDRALLAWHRLGDTPLRTRSHACTRRQYPAARGFSRVNLTWPGWHRT